jgi:hypothetical protein
MAEATINDVQQALTYILLTLLPFIFTWFGSLLTTTATQLYDIQLSNQLHLLLCHFPVKHRKKKLSMRSLLLAKHASRCKILQIKIPDSMYVPDLKICLLSPQHWAQKAHDSARGTRMETDTDGVILIWGHGDHRRTTPHSRDTNTPVFRTAPTTSTYRAFSAHVEAMEANFHRQEHVIQLPGCRHLMHDKDEFLAKENILLSNDYKKTTFLATEGAIHDDDTIKAGNVHTTQTRQTRTNRKRRPHELVPSLSIPLPSWRMTSNTSMLRPTTKPN